MKNTVNLGDFEQIVLLAILRLQQQGAYGVSIREQILANTRRNPTPGAIYTTLERLEAKGLLRSETGEATAERGGRAKRYYHHTRGGLQALQLKKRGRKVSQDAHEVEIAALRRENERLHKQLEQAELIIGAQKKLAEALEQTLTDSEDES